MTKIEQSILNNMIINIFIMQPPPQQQQQLNQWGTIYWISQLYCNINFLQFRRKKRMICSKFILIIFIGQLCTPSPFYLISREKARIWRRPRIASWPLSKPPATPIITANANSHELNWTRCNWWMSTVLVWHHTLFCGHSMNIFNFKLRLSESEFDNFLIKSSLSLISRNCFWARYLVTILLQVHLHV